MTVSDREFSFASPVPENLRHDKSKDTSLNISDKIEPEQEDDDNIKILTEVHSEEKVQKQDSSAADIDSDEDRKFCQKHGCTCKDCELLYYPTSPNSTKLFKKVRGTQCHSQKEECINFKLS